MNADNIKYDASRSMLNAGNIQDAVDRLQERSILNSTVTLTTGDDLDDVFAEGVYKYTNTVSNAPEAMNTSNAYAGRLLVLHTTDAHITQIAFPNQHPYEVFLRHYAKHDDTYNWTPWYTTSFDTYKQSISAVPYGYVSGGGQLVKCFGLTINPTHFPNSEFEITAVTKSGYYSKYVLIISSTTTTAKRVDSLTDEIYPMISKTNSEQAFIRMVKGQTSSPQPSGTEAVDMRIVKVR